MRADALEVGLRGVDETLCLLELRTDLLQFCLSFVKLLLGSDELVGGSRRGSRCLSFLFRCVLLAGAFGSVFDRVGLLGTGIVCRIVDRVGQGNRDAERKRERTERNELSCLPVTST